jgi:hypothetical protein
VQIRTARRARCQPCAPLLVTAADAAAFPTLWFSPPVPCRAAEAAPAAAKTATATVKGGKTVRGPKELRELKGSRQPPSAAAPPPPPSSEVNGESSCNGGVVSRAVPLMYDRVLCDVPCRCAALKPYEAPPEGYTSKQLPAALVQLASRGPQAYGM